MAIYKTLNASTDIISDVNAQEITAGIFSDNASTLTTFLHHLKVIQLHHILMYHK